MALLGKLSTKGLKMIITLGWKNFQIELDSEEIDQILDLMKIEINWRQSTLLETPEDKRYFECLSQAYRKWEDIRCYDEYGLSEIDLLYITVRTLVNAIGWSSERDKGWPENVDWKSIQTYYDLKNKIITPISDLLSYFLNIDGGLSIKDSYIPKKN